jgi:replicative DNA helicase
VELAETVAALAKDVFGAAVAPRISAERTWYQVYLPATGHLTHGVRNPVAAWLDDLGAFGLRSWEKRVPARVFEQSQSGIATFLRHLWATDGLLWVGADRNYPAIRYDSTSERLSRDVVSLLLRLGITARLTRVPMPGKGRPSWRRWAAGSARDCHRAAARRETCEHEPGWAAPRRLAHAGPSFDGGGRRDDAPAAG